MTRLLTYVNCRCRDCFLLAITNSPQKSAFCESCVVAGCPEVQQQPGMSQECQEPSAYGNIDLEDITT